MGRKSSAKKKRRLDKITSTKTSTKTSAKTVSTKALPKKKAQTKDKEKAKTRTKIPKQKIFGGLLAAILLTLLVYTSIELFTTAFKPASIAEYLPDGKTAAMLEINTNKDHTQLVKAQNLLSETSYNKESLTKKLEERMSLEVEKDITPWLGRQIGLAELIIDDEGTLQTVFFLETISKTRTKSALNTLAQNNLSELKETLHNSDTIYEFNLRYPGEDRTLDKSAYAVFLDKYLVFSIGTDQGIKSLLNPQKKLSENESFKEAASESAINNVAFIFLDFKQNPEALLQKYGVFSESNFLNSAITPFSKLFSSEGLVLVAEDDYFRIETFMSLENEFLKGNRYVTYKANYQADLIRLIPEDVDVFWGGVDAERQIKRIVALLSEGEETTNQVFEGVFESYAEKYFGNNVSLVEDIYPLLQNEFALTKSGENYLLALELLNPTEDALRVQKIANNFISSGAVFEPHVEEHELPDGTITKEIVATTEDLIKSETKHEGLTIYQMETESGGWGIYYSIVDSVVLVATDKPLMEKSLDLYLDSSKESLANSRIKDIHITPAIRNSDEVFYINVLPFWPESSLIKSLSTGKEYFGNGVKAYYYIYVE